MKVEDLILKDIARARHGFYTTEPPWGTMVLFQNNNRTLLESRSRIFGGMVGLSAGGPWSRYGDIRTPESIARGEYRWVMQDHEAYVFSKKILPHLAKYDQYRFDFCQKLMMRYMSDAHNQHRQV